MILSARSLAPLVLLLLLLLLLGCGAGEPPSDTPSPPSNMPVAQGDGAPVPDTLAATDSDIAILDRRKIFEPFFDDLEQMRERHTIRALVPYNHTHYFLDGATPRGLAYDALKLFEKELNRGHESASPELRVLVIPVGRDELLTKLKQGAGDLAIGGLTITDDRLQLVDFARPTSSGIHEVVVSGPAMEDKLQKLEDLSGREVWVNPGSSYYESLHSLNERLTTEGQQPLRIRAADGILEAEDLLEMVNAGLIGTTVIDDYLARFWSGVFPDIRVHQDLVLREGGELAWALRKNTPALMAEVNRFVSTTRKGTLTGNVLLQRYLGTTKWTRNIFADQDLARFNEMIELFRRYADRYRFDWLLIAAQAYQESGLDHQQRSRVGAIGIMQIMPKTAHDKNVNIPDFEKLEPNIHAGTKYLRWIIDTYFDEPELDKLNRALLGFAAYNAGPSRIASLRRETAAAGLDPNQWFRNVEMTVARKIGREPVQYVSNIYKYYLSYKMIADQMQKGRQINPIVPKQASGPG